MATHSSILVWRIPWTEDPGGLLSIGSHRVRHDWSDLAAAAVEYWNLLHPFYISTTLAASLCRRRTEFKASLFHFKDPGWVGPPGFSQLFHVGPRTSLKLWFVKDTCHWRLCRKGHKWMIGRTSSVIAVSHSVMSDSLWTPWTIACQAPLSMGFSRQEYWSRLPFPSPGQTSYFGHYSS